MVVPISIAAPVLAKARASSLVAVEVLTPPKIVFKTLTPPLIVGKTLLLTMDGLTVVPPLISWWTPVAVIVEEIPNPAAPAPRPRPNSPAPAPAADNNSVFTWVPLSTVGNTLLLTIDCLTEVPLITSFSTLVPL